jgi:tRNA-Thr(GGU) m(6)t(6)A37 methyltransferase TsaA
LSRKHHNLNAPSEIKVHPIGWINSPYKQKFGIPRQPGLAKHARGIIEFHPEYSKPEAFDGIEQFSHLWVEFYFHMTADTPWKTSVRPPRLGGNKKIGCFATRSNFRPNNLGLSVVELTKKECVNGKIKLHITGHDLLDNTPILDIKPYIPYSDSLTNAQAGLFQSQPDARLSVSFNSLAVDQLLAVHNKHPELKTLIEEVLQQDPRPAYMHSKTKKTKFTIRLYDFDICWEVNDDHATVTNLINLSHAL